MINWILIIYIVTGAWIGYGIVLIIKNAIIKKENTSPSLIKTQSITNTNKK